MDNVSSQFDILVVDDDSMLSLQAQHALSNEQYAVSIAHSAAEAIDLCNNSSFDFAIIDYHLYGLTGLDLIEKIKSHSIPFMMLTGIEDNEVVQRALKLGALSYLVKPVTTNQIEIAVATGLQCSQILKHKDKAIEVRDIVGLAIGMTMVIMGLNKCEALALLQQRARSKCQSLPKVSHKLVRIYEINYVISQNKAEREIKALLAE